MKKILALTAVITIVALSASYVFVLQLEQSEEQVLNSLEDDFLGEEIGIEFSRLEREANQTHITYEEFSPEHDYSYLSNSTVRENQVELSFYHYGSSSISPGQVREAYVDEGELNVLLVREKPVVVTADINLQKNAYRFETENQSNVETVNITETVYRDREDVYRTSGMDKLLSSVKSIFEDRWVFKERNYSLAVDESVFKESLEIE